MENRCFAGVTTSPVIIESRFYVGQEDQRILYLLRIGLTVCKHSEKGADTSGFTVKETAFIL